MDHRAQWRIKMEHIIFEADTKAGKAFDVVLIAAILLSVFFVSLETVESLRDSYGDLFIRIEWFFTFAFSLEYICRLVSAKKPLQYAKSFFGVVDLLAILPSYLSLFIFGAQSLLVVRSFRLLRVFRVFKLTQYLSQANQLTRALEASRPKITVFLVGVLATVTTMGAIMYLVEGPENGFSSIPHSIYWAIVTMTTVGYGDISPQTPLGQALASILMILGYGVIAVPTGIVSSELGKIDLRDQVRCQECGKGGHSKEDRFCRACGSAL